MRFMFRRGSDKDMQQDLNLVQETLQSGYFLLIDLIFWALLLTILTKPVHHSFQLIIIVYFCYYLSGVCLLLLLKYLIK
jgi:hypothetical protein